MIARVLSCSLSLVLFFVPGFAQSSGSSAASSGTAAVAAAGSAAAVPKDPNKLMLLAAQVNGPSGKEMKPWHLKANYQTFDEDGKPKEKGVFEEWWAGPEKWKISYTSTGFNQVRYRTGKKTLMTGDDVGPSLADGMLEVSVMHPIPGPKAIRDLDFVVQNAKDGSVALTCLREKGKSFLFPVFCLEKNSPVIRLEALPDGDMVFFNDIVLMDGKYLSEQIDVKFANLPVLSAHVTTLEPLTKIDDALFEPPAGAVAALSPPLFEPPGVQLISVGKDPKFPPVAKAANVHGTVVLAVMISPKGEVSKVRVISGPAMLRQAAIDSVKTYRFSPFRVNGQPTAFEVLVHANFH